MIAGLAGNAEIERRPRRNFKPTAGDAVKGQLKDPALHLHGAGIEKHDGVDSQHATLNLQQSFVTEHGVQYRHGAGSTRLSERALIYEKRCWLRAKPTVSEITLNVENSIG